MPRRTHRRGRKNTNYRRYKNKKCKCKSKNRKTHKKYQRGG